MSSREMSVDRMRYDFVGVGNPVYDEIETPYISTAGRVLSGCSTNACIITSKLGLKTGLIGCIGEDFLGDFRNNLADFGIDWRVQISRESGGFHLIYNESGDRELYILGVADGIEFKGIDKFLDSRFILFGPIMQEISFESVDYVKEKSDAKLFLDPQGFIREIVNEKGRLNVVHRCDRKKIREIVSRFDIVKPNEMEARIITGSKAEDACEILYSWGVDIVVITFGEKGSMIFDGSEFYNIPAFETFAKDPTGAGDTYAAGFVFEYMKSNDLEKAGLFASCTASIMVENSGPDLTVTKEEVRRRVSRLMDEYVR